MTVNSFIDLERDTRDFFVTRHVLLYSELSKQRNMYPWHIEPLDTWHRRGESDLEWRIIFHGTLGQCTWKLDELEGAEFEKQKLAPVLKAPLLPLRKKTPTQQPEAKTKHGYVYFLKANDLYKIGKSRRPPTERIAEYSPRLPFETTLARVIETGDCDRLEKALHRFFRKKHIRGEWYSLTDDDLTRMPETV